MRITEKKKKYRKIFSSRKFKFGALATAFTALFIVAVVMLNVIVSAVDSKFSLYFDLTSDQIFSISDTSKEAIRTQLDAAKEQNGEDIRITISFFRPRDQLIADQQYNWMVSLSESYAEAFDEIIVEFREDIYTHPENYTYYTDLGYTIDYSSIIVSSSLSKASFSVFNFDSCLVYDENGENVWAFKGEMKLNAAITTITSRESPVVTFLTGHGESTPKALVEVFYNCGFKVEYVDLVTEDISDDTKILIISNPQKDIISVEDDETKSEYTKISDYLNAYRSVLVIASPATPKLPVLDELMADWGIEIVRNQIIMDDSFSVPGDKRMLYVDYTGGDTISAALTKSLTDRSSPPRTVSYISAPIRILYEGDGETSVVNSVLKSSDNSFVEIVGENGTIQKQSGSYCVMALSTRFTIENNVDIYGHLLVIGSENFTETSTYRSDYGNTDIVYNIIRLLSNESIQAEVDYKVLEDYSLTMDSGEIYRYGIVAAAVIPILIFALGVCVYVKRKHM